MGELMRRYWVPALFSWEVPEPDCPPVTVKLLGEELVAFRDTNGVVGVVGARCAHRRAHLFWGRNEECGIKCVYHGWKFDIEGRCTDMPSEPEESNFKDKVRIPAYPTHEAGGVVWAYMGPPERRPAPPLFEWTQVPEEHLGISKIWQQCNWLQALEGGIDTVHTNFLHGGLPPGRRHDDNTVAGRARNTSLAPQVEVVPTDYGYVYAGIRTMGDEGNYVRAYHWVLPWYQLRPLQTNSPKPRVSGHIWVPMDDENTMVYNWTYTFGQEPLDERERRLTGSGNELYADIDVENNFRSVRNADNRYLIDRELQRTETYSGITGLNTQDRAIQESMGEIADRTLERLGTTDRAIINARRTLLKAIKTVQDGGDPPGASPTYYKLRSIEKVLPKDVSWFDAMKAELFQLEEPRARAAAP
jgi:phenylpropionate dioxygenase-like ring-hydroxylating dioxygenase large terminal subunit